MKRSLLIAAAATLGASAAMAQSTVNVYGRLNVTLERQKAGSAKDNVVANNSSRIGFRGTEDLGGGLKAFFLIEHGFDPTTGQANASFWGRESNVGLMGNFGKVRLGNMGPTAAYFTVPDYISMHNHDTGSSSDAFYLYPGSGTNAVSYTTPNFGGATVEAQVAEATGGFKRTYVVAANWVGGPLHIGATYLRGPTSFFGTVGAPTGDGKEFGVRALYELGPVTLGAYYVRNQLDVLGTGADLKRNSYRASAMYTLGATEIHANVGRAARVSGLAVGDTAATQYTVGANYNLSKRTKLYGFYTRVSNQANATYNTGITGGNNDFSSLAAGIRHNF